MYNGQIINVQDIKIGDEVVVLTTGTADFSKLSVTGGVINVKNAVVQCLELERSKVSK